MLPERAVRSALYALAKSGLPRLMERSHSGIGAILALHRIRDPDATAGFESRRETMTPAGLRHVIAELLARGYEFLSMSGVAERLAKPRAGTQKFVALTFDDGFVDTYTEAFPICREFGVPFTTYVIAGALDRTAPMWWLGLERIVAANDRISVSLPNVQLRLRARSMQQKRSAYWQLANLFVNLDFATSMAACRELGAEYGVDFFALSDANTLTPPMLREMVDSGLAEIGAHTTTHPNLRRLGAADAYREIADSRRILADAIGQPVVHFAYPYGAPHAAGPREFEMCRRSGFQTAVTTRMANLFPEDELRFHALPRLTLSGAYEGLSLLDLMLSGTLPAIRRRLVAAQA